MSAIFPGYTGIGSSLAIDASGALHLAFFDYYQSFSLRYGYRASAASEWMFEDLGPHGTRAPAGGNTAIAVDSAGTVHIVFTNGETLLANEAVHSGTGWYIAPIEQTPLYRTIALVVDSEDTLHFAGGSNMGVRYSRRPAGGAWTTEVVVSDGNFWDPVGIAVRADGVHLAWFELNDSPRGSLHDALRTDAGWDLSPGMTPILGGNLIGFAIDPTGGEHLAFPEWDAPDGPGHIVHGFRSSRADAWTFTATVPTNPSEGLALGVDSGGRPRIVYVKHFSDGGSGAELRYAHLDSSGALADEVADSDGYTGFESAVAIDRYGGVHTTYWRGEAEHEHALMYAYYCPALDD